METLKRVIAKCLSARWILTVMGGVAFLYCIWTKQLEGATITAILMMIFQSYFQRQDRNGIDKPNKDKGVS